MYKLFYTGLFSLIFLSSVIGQVPKDSTLHKLDSLAQKKDSTGLQVNNTNPEAYNPITKMNAGDYFLLLGSNIKQGFTKPFHLKKRNLVDIAKFGLVAVAVGFADEPIQKAALKWRTNKAYVRNVGSYVSQFGTTYALYTLAGLETFALITKNQKVHTTVLLASQSIITGVLIESVVKTLSGRTRPSYYGTNTEAEPSFNGPFASSKGPSGIKSNSSFPSGHSTVAFAFATVFAKEYHDKPIVPIIAYSVATIVSASRVTENKHWTTDVLVGATLGHLMGRQIVNNYHRLASVKNQRAKKRGSLSVNMQYNFGSLEPGLVYHFR